MNTKSGLVFVDDEPRILRALTMLFKREYNVFSTEHGSEALDYINKNKVHVLVSDQRMPVMQGVEVLAKAKKISPNTMRVLLTGYADLQAVIDSVNDCEIYRYVNKPWSNQQLKKNIAEAAGISEALFDDESQENSANDVNERVEVPAETMAESSKTQPQLAKSPPKSAVVKSKVSIVVAHADKNYTKIIKNAYGSSHDVLEADTIDEVFQHLSSSHVGVLISNKKVGGEDMSFALKGLKRDHPTLVSILLARADDSKFLSSLINEAQIFKYIPMPGDPAVIKDAVGAAMQRHHTYARNPLLVRSQKVEAPTELPAKSVSDKVLGYLKRLLNKNK